MSTSMIENSISKTAIDSLYAKWSVVAAGYDPVCAKENGKLYNNLTISMSEAFVNYKSSKSKHKFDGGGCGLVPSSIRTGKIQVKRQTPLVNAGYAVRIKAVSGVISRFVRTHNTEKNNPMPSLENVSSHKRANEINVMMIGCGLDVLGLWASSLYPLKIGLYEIDCEEICDLKTNAMMQAGILRHCSDRTKTRENTPNCGKDSESLQTSNGKYVFIEGSINVKATSLESTINKNPTSEEAEQFPSYTLLSADLRNISSIKEAFKASHIDTNLPTIVISELVLPYIGESNATNLLKFIASDICCRKGSMFLAYEPIGLSTNHTHVENISVAQGYTTKYFEQFLTKLNSGNKNSMSSKGNENKSDLFKPLGLSFSHVQTKLRQSGFDGPVDCCQVAKALQSCNDGHVINSPEIFDEHAALKLHLQCYGILCASSFGTNISEFLKICPWSNVRNATRDMGYWHETCAVGSKGTGFVVTSVRHEDQEQVRSLFKDSYSGIFEEYPSVKKMVKTALKTDLNDKASKIMRDKNLSDCAIWNRYSQLGGAFWVVSEGMRLSTCSSKIIGCIGVTSYSNFDSSDTSKPSIYTINRFVIDAAVRGQGIGNALLNTVENYVLWRESNSPSSIIATTPVVMQAANKLYYSNGFEVQKEVQMGKMMIRTFHKTATRLCPS